MIKNIVTVLLFAYSALAANSFIGNHKRAELFEITDNAVPVIRITLPEDEFTQLKEVANRGYCLYLPDEVLSLNHLRGLSDITVIDANMPLISTLNYNAFEQAQFETKNGTMTFELNGNVEEFDKITFKLGGSSSRMYSKSGYNIKIRGKKNLHGRTQIKLRPDSREATFLRTKLATDIHNRLDIPSISSNYAYLYINEEFMGFYVMMDSLKKSWIEFEYGDKDTTSLYECDSSGNDLSFKVSSKKCHNENDDVQDFSEWEEFLTALDNAQSAEDIEDIFDVDLFLTEIAYEYLVGSWDHFLIMGHNFDLYKPEGEKWKYLVNDFDGDFGQDISIGFNGMVTPPVNSDRGDFTKYSFTDWAHIPRHLIDILILNDSTRFDNILKNLVTEVFNPATLFPHIDELKAFVRPYVEIDKTPINGKLPGRTHEGIDDYTMEEFEANCEFTTVRSMQHSRAYGLKYWILTRYRYVCTNYNMNCDPVYMNKKFKYPIDKSVEFHIEDDMWLVWDNPQPTPDEPNESSDDSSSDESSGDESSDDEKKTKNKKTKTKKTKTTKTKKTKTTKAKTTKTKKH